jgi:hypothetical protein
MKLTLFCTKCKRTSKDVMMTIVKGDVVCERCFDHVEEVSENLRAKKEK